MLISLAGKIKKYITQKQRNQASANLCNQEYKAREGKDKGFGEWLKKQEENTFPGTKSHNGDRQHVQ